MILHGDEVAAFISSTGYGGTGGEPTYLTLPYDSQ
jgi:hypothetical protein